jgi:hypothetical protein
MLSLSSLSLSCEGASGLSSFEASKDETSRALKRPTESARRALTLSLSLVTRQGVVLTELQSLLDCQ